MLHRLSRFLALSAATLLTTTPLVAQAWRQDEPAPVNAGSVRYLPVNLTSAFNNRGVASSANQVQATVEGSFDGKGASFSSDGFYTGDTQIYNIPYVFRERYGDGQVDNVRCEGQNVALPAGRYYSMKVMVAADPDRLQYSAQTPGTFNFHYSDGTNHTIDASAAQWQSWLYAQNSEFVGNYSQTLNGTVGGPMLSDGSSLQNRTQIYSLELFIAPSASNADVVSVDLPQVTEAGAAWHLFAATLISTPALSSSSNGSTATSPQLFVESVQASQRWEYVDGSQVQYVEVTVVNTPAALGGDESHQRAFTVELKSPSACSTHAVKVTRLPKGNFLHLDVPITGGNGDLESASVTIKDDVTGATLVQSDGWHYRPGLVPYDYTSEASMSRVQAAPWWSRAKLGIMIHWGVYSVPAFGEGIYAEWYWSNIHTNETSKQHELDTYGENHAYDDFIPQFNASSFNAKDWISLIEKSGGGYMVPTSKHHDGFALFDTKETSNRNSLKLGPKRDLLKEMYEATIGSMVKFGTYFSLTEWYNPLQGPYGFLSWPGTPPTNPFTNQTQVYTGLVNVSDFINDLQTPQMRTVIDDYQTNIMWCDIGGPSRGYETLANWYNDALANKDAMVIANSRCGCLWNGFSTPEYVIYPGIVQSSYEVNLGLAPFSYGYDQTVQPDQYKTSQVLVTSLVDIVSKNGNFLVDFGPRQDGTISQPQVDALVGMGDWLAVNGDAVYATNYWSIGVAQEGDWRFTTKDGKFNIIALSQPNATYTFESPIPVIEGDKIVALADGSDVDYSIDGGKLTLKPSSAQVSASTLAWAYQIQQQC